MFFTENHSSFHRHRFVYSSEKMMGKNSLTTNFWAIFSHWSHFNQQSVSKSTAIQIQKHLHKKYSETFRTPEICEFMNKIAAKKNENWQKTNCTKICSRLMRWDLATSHAFTYRKAYREARNKSGQSRTRDIHTQGKR